MQIEQFHGVEDRHQTINWVPFVEKSPSLICLSLAIDPSASGF
jgi:hypothetical protein